MACLRYETEHLGAGRGANCFRLGAFGGRGHPRRAWGMDSLCPTIEGSGLVRPNFPTPHRAGGGRPRKVTRQLRRCKFEVSMLHLKL